MELDSAPEAQRGWNTPVRVGAFVLAGLAAAGFFQATGEILFEADHFLLRIPSRAHFQISWFSFGAMVVLLAWLAWWSRRAKAVRALAPRAFWDLLPALIVAAGGTAAAYRFVYDWRFATFVGGAFASLVWVLREEVNGSLDRVRLWAERPRLALVPVALAIASAWVLNVWMFGGQPYIIDSCARLAHALILDRGMWWLPSTSHDDLLIKNCMVVHNGRYFSQYLPGAILIHLAGLKIGTLNLIPSLMAGGVVLATYSVGGRLFGPAQAFLGALLLTLSPGFIVLSASFMDHTPTAFFLMAALWFGLKDLRIGEDGGAGAEGAGARQASSFFRREWLLPLCMGLCLGYATMMRPLTVVGWAGPYFVVWALLRRRARRPVFSSSLLLAAGWGVFVAFILFFDYKTTGNAFVTGYRLSNPVTHSLGFTAANHHTPLKAVIQAADNIYGLSDWLFFWPMTSLVFILVLFLTGRDTTRDRLLLLPFAGLMLVYFFYPYQDKFFSPRFLSEAVPLLTLLTARGAFSLVGFISEKLPDSTPVSGRAPRFVAALLVGLGLCASQPLHYTLNDYHEDTGIGVQWVMKNLTKFHDDPLATVFMQNAYSHRALVDQVRTWGKAEFLTDPGTEKRTLYMKQHPERHFFLFGRGGTAEALNPPV